MVNTECLVKHAKLAQSLGMPKENIVIGENGSVIELTPESICINGKVTVKVLIDGLVSVTSVI